MLIDFSSCIKSDTFSVSPSIINDNFKRRVVPRKFFYREVAWFFRQVFRHFFFSISLDYYSPASCNAHLSFRKKGPSSRAKNIDLKRFWVSDTFFKHFIHFFEFLSNILLTFLSFCRTFYSLFWVSVEHFFRVFELFVRKKIETSSILVE
jgi:hypothetical protein